MKVYDILARINDVKLYIKLIDRDYNEWTTGTKKEIEKTSFYNSDVLLINVQYTEEKRTLILMINDWR